MCALVVTRNRRELLGECLTALLSQTHALSELVVLDNASTDGTAEWLGAAEIMQSPIVRFARNEVNSGGAGGYADGLRLCLESSADWIWLMDDDAEPRPDALERLLNAPPALGTRAAALCTGVVHPDGRIDPLHRCRMGRFITPLPTSAYGPGSYAPVDCASFVGLLIRGSVARALAPPRREFFLGYDDAEYSLRIREHGEITLVPESVIVHKIAIGGGEQTVRSKLFNRLLGQHYSASPWTSYWKDLYRVRNFVALKRSRGTVGPLELSVLVAGYVAKALMYESRPLRCIPWIVRYALKGWRGDFSGPTPEQWVEFAGRPVAPGTPGPA